MPLLGDRLRAERERLGLSQQELADLCGVTMRSQRNYEKGERQPDAAYLAAMAAARIDMLYVVTGQRSGLPVTGDAVREMGLRGQALRESGVLRGEAVKETGIARGQVVEELRASGVMPGSALAQAGLSRREKALLANYRGSDEQGRKALEGAASALAHKDSDPTKRQGGE